MSNESDALVWAEHYRASASEFMRRADAALDHTVQTQLRFLAEQYLRLLRRRNLPASRLGGANLEPSYDCP